jgi:hypothetical protein
MRTHSAAINEILGLENLVYFYIVEIGPYVDLDSNPNQYKRYSSLHGDVTIDSKTYTGGSKLITVDPPRLSSSVDREAYKISIADPDYEFRGLFERGFSQIKVTISIGFFNTSSHTIGSTLVGSPFLDIADTIIVYKGYIDNHVYAIDLNGGTVVSIECTSPMGSLNMSRPRLTTNDSMKQLNITDTSFSQVYQGSKGIGLLWGKRVET